MNSLNQIFSLKRAAKRIIFLLIISHTYVFLGQAQSVPPGFDLISYEGFNYASGSSLLNASGGSGWSSNWQSTYQDRYLKTSTTGFTYTGLTTLGLKAEFDNACYGLCNQIAALGRSIPLQIEGVVYIQFISIFETTATGGTPTIRLLNGITNNAMIGANTGSFMSIVKITDGILQASSTAPLNAQNLVVVRIDYNANKTELWVNPNLTTFDYSNPTSPAASLLDFSPSFDKIDIFIRSGSIDEIAVFKESNLIRPLAPVISPDGGTFVGSTTVELSAEVGAQIYYTLDGSDPTPSSSLYAGPFAVGVSGTVRAVAFANGELGPETTADFVIRPLATVSLASLSQTYDGTAKSATATTNPAFLTVTFTYDGSATAPTAAGSYAVVATVVDDNYVGTASGTLEITAAALTFGTFAAINKQYFAGPQTIVPPTTNNSNPIFYTSDNTAVATIINGSTIIFSGIGTANITATQAADANYEGGTVSTLLTVLGKDLVSRNGGVSSTDVNYVNANGKVGSGFGVDKYGAIQDIDEDVVPSVTPSEDVVPFVTSSTGRIWMDRNLGATRVAESSTDFNAYGDLYQWGRGTDGHQTIVWISSTSSNGAEQSNQTTVQSSSPSPGTTFILESDNWYNGPNPDDLWKEDGTGVNNPCPSGYRLPTDKELNEEFLSWGSQNSAGAFASPLKLTMPGYRSQNDGGPIYLAGVFGGYWGSTVSGTDSFYLYFDTIYAFMEVDARAGGGSVRCIKN